MNQLRKIVDENLNLPSCNGISLSFTSDTTEDEWLQVAQMLSKAEQSLMWWIGDWWRFGNEQYGCRKALVESDDWDGPTYETCMNAASVCKKFETSRRREALPFGTHQELCGLDDKEAEKMLDWCEETLVETGKRPTRQAIREKIGKKGAPLVTLYTGEDEWFTPSQYIEAARGVLGIIDLDPASNEVAQETVKATSFYTMSENGLDQEWFGNVWLNPPYSRGLITAFIDKALVQWSQNHIEQMIILVNNATDANWFQSMLEYDCAVCFPDHRIKFYDQNGEQSSPVNGQAFCYFGLNKNNFVNVFEQFGTVMEGV